MDREIIEELSRKLIEYLDNMPEDALPSKGADAERLQAFKEAAKNNAITKELLEESKSIECFNNFWRKIKANVISRDYYEKLFNK